MSGRPSGEKIPTWLVVVGGVPLLLVMVVEFITVISRNSGFTVYGSIEVVQAAILLSSATAIVLATLNRSHAKVHFLLNRSRGTTGKVLKLFNALCACLFFLALTVGGVWIALDMWGLQERSEMLGIPYAPLRWFAAVCTATTCGLYLWRLVARSSKDG